MIRASGILIYTICCINIGNAQLEYFNDEPIWKLSSSCSAPYPCLLNSEYIYYIHHDTLIFGESYKSIFKKSFNTYQWMGPPRTKLSRFLLRKYICCSYSRTRKESIYSK